MSFVQCIENKWNKRNADRAMQNKMHSDSTKRHQLPSSSFRIDSFYRDSKLSYFQFLQLKAINIEVCYV